MSVWEKVKSALGFGAKKAEEAVDAVKKAAKNVKVTPPDAPNINDVVSGNNKKSAGKKPAAKKK